MIMQNAFLEKEYYENGNLKKETPYKNGNREGLVKVHYENGNLKLEVVFKEGKPVSGYAYDGYGNKTKLTNDHLHHMIERLNTK